MRDFDYIICGNNAGTLVTALALAGRRKVAVVNPAPNWGGIFAGIKIDGKQFDIGMAFLEFASFYPQSGDLGTYSSAIYNDSARFLNYVRDFFAQRADFAEVENLKTLLDGVFYEDIVAANNLQILPSLPSVLKEKIISELKEIVAQGRFPMHAAHKKINKNLFLMKNYSDVSAANHGRTLHDLLFSPLCRKIFNISGRELPALFHRAAWCPLYYPETLLAAARGEKVDMPRPAFHYPKDGGFAKIIELLVAELPHNDNITVLRDRPSGLEDSKFPSLHLGGGAVTAKKIIWCGDLQNLCALSGAKTEHFHFVKSSMTMVFVEINKTEVARNFSTVFVCNPGEFVYRVTNQNAAHPQRKTNKFIFEMNTEVLSENGINEDGEIIAHVRKFAAKAGIFSGEPGGKTFVVRHFKDALTTPTTENLQKFYGLQKMAQSRLRNVECVGASASFASGSLNDQIVAALHLGEKYGSD